MSRHLVTLFLFAANAVFAQGPGDFRVIGVERAVQMRVQVLYPGGTALYDSEWKSGSIVDWNAGDLPYGAYQLRVSSRDLDGKLTEKQTTLQVSPDRISIDPALPEDLKLTTTAHDGTTGQIITTSGDLSFRFGDFLNRKDTEAMRLTPEGNLEVKGWIRAGQGILFPDGTTVDSKKLRTKADATGTGTMNQISKWTDSAGTLGDSAVSEVGGNVGIGTATPSGKLHIFGAATTDVFAGIGVDMIAGPAFNFGYGGASFGRGAGFLNARPDGSAVAPNPSLRFLTNNAERMIITNAGNIGIGTSTPGGRFQIFAAPTADVFAGIGTDMSAGPSMNFGYGGATFGRGAGFFNARPDASAVSPNPSLRFMTTNVERMIVTNDGNVGIGTSAPTQKLDVNGNFALPATTSLAAGVVMMNGRQFIHAYGISNTFLGQGAGNFTMTGGTNTVAGNDAFQFNTSGYSNTANGALTLQNNTTGSSNTAIGVSTLQFNTTGAQNTASGVGALEKNTTGYDNTANGVGALSNNTIGNENTASGSSALASNTSACCNTATGFDALFSNNTGGNNTANGWAALPNNTSGYSNTACGSSALQNNTTGHDNIAIGYAAGFGLTTGSSNIDIGNQAVAATESSTIRIGGVQTRAFIVGIRDTTTAAADAIPVIIDSNGQLGTISSSRRYKYDISEMRDSTNRLMDLRPVTFRYIAHGKEAPLQYGLLAEDVAEVYPELVARNKDGQPETVMYQFLAPMLLNELQKEHRRNEELERRLAALERQFATH